MYCQFIAKIPRIRCLSQGVHVESGQLLPQHLRAAQCRLGLPGKRQQGRKLHRGETGFFLVVNGRCQICCICELNLLVNLNCFMKNVIKSEVQKTFNLAPLSKPMGFVSMFHMIFERSKRDWLKGRSDAIWFTVFPERMVTPRFLLVYEPH